MKEGLIKNAYEDIIKEIQTIITISYILAVGIGMLFNFQKFSEFGINIFDYADVFDFLIAPFSDFKILLFSLISISATFLLLKFDTFWKKRFPKFYSKMSFGWDKKEWYTLFRYFTFAVLFVYYLYISADFYGRIAATQIKEKPPINLRYSDNEIINGIVIGKTNDIIFLLKDDKIRAIPITSLVKEFEIE